MQNNTELISRYLQNEMSATERSEFETLLKTDKDFFKEYTVQKQIIKAAVDTGIKNEFKKVIRKKIVMRKILKLAIIIAVAGAAILFYGAKNNWFSHEGGRVEIKSTILPELFEIDNSSDTIIETKEGVVFGIPANAFNSGSKNIQLEIKTALDVETIMQNGLSTMSNGAMLQTAGMFYLNAMADGKKLSLIKDIAVSVPAKDINPSMLLFDGVEDSNGIMNWVNPKPIEKKLRTYDITTLDFYPPNYIPTLKALQKDYANKKYTDSLYYSFSNNSTNEVVAGKTLFAAKCATCHNIFRMTTGPALQHLEERGKWSDHNEILKWVNNPAKYMANDPYTKRLKEQFGSIMSANQLTIKEIDNIVTYINDEVKKKESGEKSDYQRLDTISKNFANDSTRLSEEFGVLDTTKLLDELDPARIRTIWNKKFNNTILATKEFEERLKYIHGLCSAEYLDAYLEGLNKPLYEIDQAIANKSSGKIKKKFLEFAARKDGGVVIATGIQQKLSSYFQQKYQAYREATIKTQAKYEEELNKLNSIADEKQRDQEKKEYLRDSKNFEEELCINLTESYKQIGIKRSCNDTIVPPSTQYYNFNIIDTGWKNLDVYVFEATVNRESMTYTDPATGKTATLTYSDISIQIEDQLQYDKVLLYLIPDSLSGFQRMAIADNGFKEKLNSLFKYDAIALAYKGTEVFYYRQHSIEPGTHVFKLAMVDNKKLSKILKEYSITKTKELRAEFEYQLFEQQEVARQVQIQKNSEFRDLIASSIFACGEKTFQEGEATTIK